MRPEYKTAIDAVVEEIRVIRDVRGPFTSGQEGYTTLLQTVGELWEEIKKDPWKKMRLRSGAKLVAATAICFMVECCGEKE